MQGRVPTSLPTLDLFDDGAALGKLRALTRTLGSDETMGLASEGN